ncbi:YkvI family membrane protein [Bacillus massiliigorillae]|uniref:YkvI family membrane protein n=1 Tax=Bacillus massiliigorillae TaxID=1243664 RepID=UPI0003A45221|nr:membrane protein [Bacillus massiliigorillae]
MRSKLSGAWQIAAVYVGTVVGAGFATGREIIEFFTKYGFIGFLSILLAGYLFIVLGTKIMLLSVSINAKTYEEVNNHLFGKRWSPFINILFFVMLFGVTAVMLSGAGAVFEEQVGVPKMIGVAITAIVALIVLHNGIKGLVVVNMLVVPSMIMFSVLLFVQVIGTPGYFQDFVYISNEINYLKSIISPFLYSAFNLALAQAVLVPVAYEIKNPSIIRSGGVLGGICLTLILLTSHLSLITLPNILEYDIPSAELMKSVATPFYWVFIFVIYGEIFSSLVGNIFGLEKQLQKYINVKSMSIFLALLLAAYLVSLIQYRTLLSVLYPLFGYVSLVFLLLLFRSKE